MLQLKTPKQYPTFRQYTSFTKYLYFLRYGAICATVSQIFSPFQRTQKFKLDIFLPCILSSTQIEPKKPKRSQFDPHLHHETGIHT